MVGQDTTRTGTGRTQARFPAVSLAAESWECLDRPLTFLGNRVDYGE